MGKWFITTLQVDKEGTILDSRCVGYYDEMEQAMWAVRNNAGDIHETNFNWAVIEHFGGGIYPQASCELWYQWFAKERGYMLSAKPKFFERVVNFGIG
jgi:hypothetical protein